MIEPRQNGGFAHELLAGFLEHGRRKGRVVAHLLDSAIPAGKTFVLGEVNKTVPTLTDDAFNLIALMKHGADACLKRHDLYLSYQLLLQFSRRKMRAVCLHYNVKL